MTGAGGMAQSGMFRQRRQAWAVPLAPAAGIGEQALVNYRHAFHAGNFADLVKHAALTRLLARLMADPSPLTVVDTHAGAGLYDLPDARGQAGAGQADRWRRGRGVYGAGNGGPPVRADRPAVRARRRLRPHRRDPERGAEGQAARGGAGLAAAEGPGDPGRLRASARGGEPAAHPDRRGAAEAAARPDEDERLRPDPDRRAQGLRSGAVVDLRGGGVGTWGRGRQGQGLERRPLSGCGKAAAWYAAPQYLLLHPQRGAGTMTLQDFAPFGKDARIEPEKAFRLGMGAVAAPLWAVYYAAAGAGVAYWAMTAWTRGALLGEAKTFALAEPLAPGTLAA